MTEPRKYRIMRAAIVAAMIAILALVTPFRAKSQESIRIPGIPHGTFCDPVPGGNAQCCLDGRPAITGCEPAQYRFVIHAAPPGSGYSMIFDGRYILIDWPVIEKMIADPKGIDPTTLSWLQILVAVRDGKHRPVAATRESK